MFNGFAITTAMNREDKAFQEFTTKVAGFAASPKNELTNLTDFTAALNSELSKLRHCQNFILKEKYKSILMVENQTESTPSEIFRWMRDRKLSFQNISRVIPLDLVLKLGEADTSIKPFVWKIGKWEALKFYLRAGFVLKA
ncbi:uncharacterized protein VICG_01628 [Vittaforma corneae ATCC 50505]|uniref:Uncharacterized protein n=1 Tax=Vittaforma corneae (strain ATCC 50505) TaxID=993615 RepID=L2GM60_VITCO|nr:uncharacterized protein VICG_01628 [Vittaforma corneae ATCC 50505]ELA41387.1 hypothetical protein VICG_01628 [Vittaforma corneae ATCC 50505]